MARELGNRTFDPRLDTQGKQALFDNLGEEVALTLEVYQLIKVNAKQGFRTNDVKKAKLRRALESFTASKPFDVDDILRIVINNPEF